MQGQKHFFSRFFFGYVKKKYVHGEAEVGLERLHLCAEKELQIYIKKDAEAATKDNFSTFREKLTCLTELTRSYFKNLVQAVKNGLSEVASSDHGHPLTKGRAKTIF